MDVLWGFESEVFVFVIVCRWPLHATTANVHSMFVLHIIVVAINYRFGCTICSICKKMEFPAFEWIRISWK